MKRPGLIEESSRMFLLKLITSRLGRPEKTSDGNVVKLFPVTEMKRQNKKIYVLTTVLFSQHNGLDTTFFL